MKTLKNIHPGEVLQEEFLLPLNITAYKLSKETHIPQTRVSEIIKGNRRITADTALRLGIFHQPSKNMISKNGFVKWETQSNLQVGEICGLSSEYL